MGEIIAEPLRGPVLRGVHCCDYAVSDDATHYCDQKEINKTSAAKNQATVCLGSTNIFFYFQFYAQFGISLRGVGKSFLLSKDELLTPNIDGVMVL